MAAAWQEELAAQVAALRAAGGRAPGLGVVLVGDRPDSALYVARKREACERVGVAASVVRLPAAAPQAALRAAVRTLCEDPLVDGVLVQLPLPPHIDEEAVIDSFDPGKDVDGFHPLNVGRTLMRGRAARFVPCTALGCVELLRRSGVGVRGKSVAIVGDSNIVGMPLAMLFRDAGAATVTVVHRSSYSGLFAAGPEVRARLREPPCSAASGAVLRGQLPARCGARLRAHARLPPRAPAMQSAERRAKAAACLPRVPGLSSPRLQHPYEVSYSSTVRGAPRQEAPRGQAAPPAHLADLASITRTADVLVVAVGYPQLVKRDWIKPGAVVVDVGINGVDWHPAEAAGQAPGAPAAGGGRAGEDQPHFHGVGDVDVCDAGGVASALTPVPGGVGPMTIAALLHNTVQAAAAAMGLAAVHEQAGGAEGSEGRLRDAAM